MFYPASKAITIFIDLLILIAPIPLLTTAKINMRKKVVVCLLFGLGFFVTICQIFRYRAVDNILNSKVHESSLLILWSAVELNVAIITTCMPTLAPLFRYFTDHSKHSRSENIRLGSGAGYKSKTSRSSHSHPLNFGASHAGVFSTETQITAQPNNLSHSDNESQERIVKETEYSVRVDRTDSDGLDILMYHPPKGGGDVGMAS